MQSSGIYIFYRRLSTIITIRQEMLTKGNVDEFDESVRIRQHLIS